MTQNQNGKAHGDEGVPDPPEGLEIIEWTTNQRFRVRERVSWSTKGMVSLFLAIGIAVLLMPITQDSMVEDFLKTKWGELPSIIPSLVRALLIAAAGCLLLQIIWLLFGTTEIQGTRHGVSSYKRLFGIPRTHSMNANEFKWVDLEYYRGRPNRDSGSGEPLPGTWKLRMMGRDGSLKLYRTTSMEDAKWLSRFLSEWYGVEAKQTRDKRRLRW